jgi:cholest-4-en-3-one 26-monooxygenase
MVFDWSNQMIGYDDPEYEGDSTAAAAELIAYSMAMADDRKKCPRDDIVSTLVHAQVGGEALSADEFGYFMVLLAPTSTKRCSAIRNGLTSRAALTRTWDLAEPARTTASARIWPGCRST